MLASFSITNSLYLTPHCLQTFVSFDHKRSQMKFQEDLNFFIVQNHFDQAELIIQRESGDFAFVIPACAASSRPTIIRTMTNSDHFIMQHHLDSATCVGRRQCLLLNIFSWKSNTLKALDRAALCCNTRGSMQTATLLEKSSFTTLSMMSVQLPIAHAYDVMCVLCCLKMGPTVCFLGAKHLNNVLSRLCGIQ